MALQSSFPVLRRADWLYLLLSAYSVPDGALRTALHSAAVQYTCRHPHRLDQQSDHVWADDVLRLYGGLAAPGNGHTEHSGIAHIRLVSGAVSRRLAAAACRLLHLRPPYRRHRFSECAALLPLAYLKVYTTTSTKTPVTIRRSVTIRT